MATEEKIPAESGLSDPFASAGYGPRPIAAGGVRNLKQQLFEAVRATGRIPRVELARTLGISPASVSSICSELIAGGLIEESNGSSKTFDSNRGRPRVALSVRGKARYVAGIKLADQTHSAVILDLSGAMVADASMNRSGNSPTEGTLIAEALAVLDRALAAAELERADLSSIGVGIPGMIDHVEGKVLWSPLLIERDVDLRGLLSRAIGLPVEIDNDANLVAMAELWFGAGRERSDFAVVTIEHGVGMGLVMDHKVYRGARGLGMELGHTTVQLDGALCRCGKRGCLEAYVADYALIREARTALNLGNRGVKSPQVLLESLYDHAKAGNEAARAIFGRAGRYLAAGLANVTNIFDPTLILLSGDRLRYDYLYAEEVLSEMRNLMTKTSRPAPEVEIRAWGDLLWARGAAALALDMTTREAFSAEANAA